MTDGAGGAILVWEDGRKGSQSDLYAQRVGPDGQPLWSAKGVAVCTAENDQTYPALVSDGAGGAIVAWRDNRTPSAYALRAIYVQRLNSLGVPQWPADGVALTANAHSIELTAIAPDGLGGAVVAWVDYVSSPPHVFAQRVNASGTPLWPASGVPVRPGGAWQEDVAIATDGAGGAFVTWDESEDIYAQHLDATGEPRWTANGIALCSAPGTQSFPAAVADGAGGASFFWIDQRGLTAQIFGQRVKAAGTPAWTADGVPICASYGNQWFPTPVTDGASGAIVTWPDDRDGNWTLYAQRVDTLGAARWTSAGVPLGAFGADQRHEAVSDGAGGAIVAWSDTRGTTRDLYAQRVGGGGTVLWNLTGAAACTHDGDQNSPSLTPDGTGGAIVSWRDSRSVLDLDLYAQRIGAAGSPVWAADGVAVHLEPGAQVQPASAGTADGGLVVAWSEKRGDQYDLLARKVDINGTPMWPTVAVCTSAGAQLRPCVVSDDANGAIIAWEDVRGGTTADVYAQRVSAAGTTAWTANGIPLCTAVKRQQNLAMVRDGVGGAIVVWEDQRNGGHDFYAQRVDADGATRWAPDGVTFGGAGVEERAVMVPDLAGGAIIGWVDFNAGAQVHLQRLRATGTASWSAGGIAVCTPLGSHRFPAMVADGQGGAFVAWSDSRNAPFPGSNWDLFAQRVDSTGARRWAIAGVPVCTAAADQDNVAMTPDGAGGVLLAWTDLRSLATNDVYMQRLDGAGTPHWTPNGLVVSAAAGNQLLPTLVPDGAGGGIVLWLDDRNFAAAPPNVDLYAQHLSAVGTALWTAGGLGVSTAAGDQNGLVAASDGLGGAFLVWQDWRGGDGSFLWTQRLDGNGAFHWGPDGVTPTLVSLVSADARPGRVSLLWRTAPDVEATLDRRIEDGPWTVIVTLVADGSGRLGYDDRDVVAGQRYGYRLRIREGAGERIAGEAWVTLPAGLRLALEGALPNPTGGTLAISFVLPSASPATLELLDPAGRRVLVREVGTLGAGPHRLAIDRGRLPRPGLYFLRLRQGDEIRLSRVTILE